MSENSSDLGAFLAGFVIGGLVGAATALILAPQSGEETRGKLVSKSNELRQASGERVQHYREAAESYTQEYRDRAGNILADTRTRIQDVGGQVQEQARIVLDSGKEQASRVRNQVSTLVQKDSGEEAPSAEND